MVVILSRTQRVDNGPIFKYISVMRIYMFFYVKYWNSKTNTGLF